MLATWGRNLFLAALLLTGSSRAWALPHTVFDVRPGTIHDAFTDGTVPESVVMLVLSNSRTACEDLQQANFRSGIHYMFMLLSVQADGHGELTGCYDMGEGTQSACESRVGRLEGVQIVPSSDESEENMPANAAVTGGHVEIREFEQDANGIPVGLRGFANLRLNDIATGGVVEADYCSLPFSKLRSN